MHWVFPQTVDQTLACGLAAELAIAPFVAELLCNRGLQELAMAKQFLLPRLNTLSDPFLLPDMEAGVHRILTAIDAGEQIVLYGDYDVDGVSSLALLTRVLRAFGAAPECFLPTRVDEGYGLSPDGVARCLATYRPRLLIAVDCGTSSVAEIAALTAQGVDTIVLDHHECKALLPICAALINPKRGANFHYLCSAGLVFKLAHALLKQRPLASFDLREHLDLVALGTVADLVPLVEENRVLVRHGLARLAESKEVGMRALVEVAGLSAPFTPAHIGFGLGPRLNAAGRLGTAQDALELLLTEDSSRARKLAQSLDQQNRERRAVENDVLEAAGAQLAEWFDPTRDAAIVVGAAGWHPGVVGIVASRILRRYHRPTIVIGFDESGLGKGSGRSIPGLSLVHALEKCAPLLERFGGHEMAAGVTLQATRFAEFRDAFRATARELLTDDQLLPRLRLDAELTLADVTLDLLTQHAALQPFGMANPEPIFFARGVTLDAEPRVLKEKHRSLELRQRGAKARAIWFNCADQAMPQTPWDIAFTVERNEFRGSVTPQIHIKAVRTAV